MISGQSLPNLVSGRWKVKFCKTCHVYSVYKPYKSVHFLLVIWCLLFTQQFSYLTV